MASINLRHEVQGCLCSLWPYKEASFPPLLLPQLTHHWKN